jgi:hypothetical protein
VSELCLSFPLLSVLTTKALPSLVLSVCSMSLAPAQGRGS